MVATNPTLVVGTDGSRQFGMTAGEKQSVEFDMTDDLLTGDAVTLVTVTLTNLDTSAVVTLSTAPITASPTVTVTFDGPNDGLVAGQSYRCRVHYTASVSGNTFDRDLMVVVSA